jgi:hypothetical protein
MAAAASPRTFRPWCAPPASMASACACSKCASSSPAAPASSARTCASACSQPPATGHDVLCVDNFFTGTKANVAHLLDNPRFELMRHDVTFPLYVEVDEIYNLACPASPIHYQHDPVQTTKTSVHGAINMLGLAKRLRPDPAGLDQRGLRRPGRAPAARGLLGQRQPDRPAPATTKASAAPKPCSSTTTASTPADQGGAHLQHLRPAHAPQRRPRGQQLHRAGAARARTSPSTATAADPQLLLRRATSSKASCA